jgi:hypothetical protein
MTDPTTPTLPDGAAAYGHHEFPDGRRLDMTRQTDGGQIRYWLTEPGEETRELAANGDELGALLTEMSPLGARSQGNQVLAAPHPPPAPDREGASDGG